MKITECKKCEYGKRFSIDRRWFIGCTYPPFKGRYVAQIEECPKEQDHPTEKGGVE